MAKQIYIFDTTLRDGQQSPGAGMSFKDNMHYAELASAMKIDILEAGFPAASPLDFEIVQAIAKNTSQENSALIIAGLCQLREAQVEKTMEALLPRKASQKALVHMYVPVSPELMQASLHGNLKHEQILSNLAKLCSLAVKEGFKVEFSPEGYSRQGANFDFTTQLIQTAIEAGASIINCPDTIGGACEREGSSYFVNKMNEHAEIMAAKFDHPYIWSTHCHNDLGLALANSMNAVFNGPAQQVECSINGIGERAGNASLEQCVMYIDSFGSTADLYSNINLALLKQASDFISEKMLIRQPHFPIVGENAARHTSGGHTNAILNNPLAYQPFDPARVGSTLSFVFGPLSGGNHAKKIIEEASYICLDSEKAALATQIKDHYKERRKGITDTELLECYKLLRAPIKAHKLAYSKNINQEAQIHILGQFFADNELNFGIAGNNSALAALLQAINKYMEGLLIKDYSSRSVGSSVNALSQSTIIVTLKNGNSYTGLAEDSDIEISAIKALIAATNTAYVEENFRVQAK